MNDIKELIANGQTKEALDALLEVTQSHYLYNEILLLKSQFSTYHKEKLIGISENKRDLARINLAILVFYDRFTKKINMEPLKKRLSSASIIALNNALAQIYWFKSDLKRFVFNTLGNSSLLSGINWDLVKRDIVSDLMSKMCANQDLYLNDLIKLMEEVSKISDFTHLENVDEGKKKAQDAKKAVEAVKKEMGNHLELVQGLHEQEKRINENIEKQIKLQSMKGKLSELKNEYFHLLLSKEVTNQVRGFKLETIMKSLFEIHDLDPKASFKIVGEQLDGAFVFENSDFLFEAKWQKELISANDLDIFSTKVSRKLENTLGLFLSISGFSEEGIKAHSGGRKVIILMDGRDLIEVFEERIDLIKLISRKKRHASQTGEIYLKVEDLY